MQENNEDKGGFWASISPEEIESIRQSSRDMIEEK